MGCSSRSAKMTGCFSGIDCGKRRNRAQETELEKTLDLEWFVSLLTPLIRRLDSWTLPFWDEKIIHKHLLTTGRNREFSKNLFSLVAFYFVRISILQVVVVNVKNIYVEAIPVDAFAVLNFTKPNM